jgi:hypothetical protein
LGSGIYLRTYWRICYHKGYSCFYRSRDLKMGWKEHKFNLH